MIRKHPYRRQQPQLSEPHGEMAENSQNNSDSHNSNNNSTQDNHNGHMVIKQEPLLEEQFKNKCAIKSEPVPQYIYTYSHPPHAMKKSNERNHNSQDIFYPVPTFDEAVQIYQRGGYPEPWPKEENNSQNWENNPPKHFNHEMSQKEINQFPPVVFSPIPFPYGCEMQNYPQMPVMQANQEMGKPYQSQFDGPPMKFYYWPPNTPNVFRPGGEPIPLKNVDVFAQISVAEDYSDLPMDNMETLRFFYNLGIKYFRLGGLLCSPLPSNPDGPVCEQDLVSQDRNTKKKDYYRKMNIPQKSYRTL